MKLKRQKKQQKDVFLEMLPQAIAALKKTLITPLFGENQNSKYANEKPPLRSELFTVQQMEQHARKLAQRHTLTESQSSEHLLKRLAENESILLEVHQLLTGAVKENHRIVPAGEWLLDNFYLIEEQIYIGKKHLPKGYSKGLPQLNTGSSEGLPRVYDIAVELISHSDGRVDMESLSGFIAAYQKITSLKLGELWAIPIMLRLALLENLRRLSTQIALDILNKNLADHWADEMTETAEKDPKSLVLVIADMARSNPPMESSFVAELTRRLQGNGSLLSLPLSWIEQRLSENGLTSSELVNLENQKQAADQVSISNSINSLRFLNTTDWREFVEKESIVEKILLEDVNGIYGKMDFYTRDHYRHIIETTSKYSHLSEEEIASLIIKKTKERKDDSRCSHVGHYLVGKGCREIEKEIKVKLPVRDWSKRVFNRMPFFFYTVANLILTIILNWVLISKTYNEGLKDWRLIILGLVCAISTSHLTISFINWLATLIAQPNMLPRMDYSKGIPPEYRSLVAIPTMLTSIAEIDSLVEALEVRFLANRDEHLHFALLTDFKDAKEQILPEDEELLQYVKNKIIDLNKKYGRTTNDTFFLFHRPRKWNPKEKSWMGYERKRGKLTELNAVLRGRGAENFLLIIGEESLFTQIKYVITLDTDTKLPRETAWKMIGTLSHPLNQALYSEKKQRVVDGYTILQPRVSNSLPGAHSSVYARIHGNEPGTDPYTRAISSVYQDLFGEGSFIGKGIYDVDMFEMALEGRFPENRILSHDLIEGCYSRSGFISDVQLYEEYPSHYNADMKRRHRWIRGDWQIARWLFPFVPSPDKRYRKNPLSPLSRWKIFDNLRRSLMPVCLILLLLFGWTYSSTWFWTFAVVGIIILPSVISFVYELTRKPKDVELYQHITYVTRSAGNNFLQHLFEFVFLPYEAYINIDAIARTAWRMFISRRKLLEWTPHNNTINNVPRNIFSNYITMWAQVVFATGVLSYLLYYSSLALIIQLPVLILWLIGPFIAFAISHTYSRRKPSLNKDQRIYLQKLSRKIWAFFEKFVDERDNWLPPDNYQEHPAPKIAHRTSPTNIGMSLLSNLTAYDFGYISAERLIERTTNTLNTVQSLEKYRGHLYNWYDTVSLVPLKPMYISTVDSGNFVGHLITLKQGLLSIQHDKIFSNKIFKGILDTVEVLLEKNERKVIFMRFKKELEAIIASDPDTLIEVKVSLNRIQGVYNDLMASYTTGKDEESEAMNWVELLGTQIKDAGSDLSSFAPWTLLSPPTFKFNALSIELENIPTLTELSNIQVTLLPKVKEYYQSENTLEEIEWLDSFMAQIIESGRRAKERILILEKLIQKCTELSNIEYDFLYNKAQHLLAIGYNAEEHRRDNSYYDLLASEARLTTFIGIAQGKLPQESWFALGRQLTNLGTTPVLLSWSGSMFEYLMPILVMPSYENTLLDYTHKAIVQKQIEYGRKRGIPWGISESGYNMVDVNLNYQYKAFGVPGLGFKRGLAEDLVISPYSTIMALMVMPEESYHNLEVLSKEGFEGEYGFYEAIDYTVSRLPRGHDNVIIRSFMAHHQGMSLLSLSYLLLDQPMQKRFESEVQMQSTLLLLQERIPRVSTFYSPSIHTTDSSVTIETNETAVRVIDTPHTPIPEVQLLSNGRYNVMLTNAGGGYSKWKDIAVTRWREDCTCDNWGTFCFIKDVESNNIWSSAYQPTLQEADSYEAVFSQGRVEFRRRDHALETHTEIIVSPEDDVELRRIHITNRSRKKRTIQVTSYAEVVLANPNADSAHPAFSNLFVQTEIREHHNAIICNRRPRSVNEQTPTMFHLMKIYSAETQNISYETDRSKFIGRGSNIHDPKIMRQSGKLSGTQGSVLDPIVSIQYTITIEPQQTAIVDVVIGIADTKELCNILIEKYQDKYLADRGFELSWTHSQVVLRQINASESDAQLYGRLAASVIFANPALRADANVITRNYRGQSALWSYSISGDLPIVLVQIENSENIELVKQMIQAHAYWRLKGLIVDLVIWNEDHGGYRQTLQNQILGLISPNAGADLNEHPGGVFIRSADQISNEDRILFQTVARIVISDKLGTLEEQINRRSKIKNVIPYFSPTKFHPSVVSQINTPTDLQFFNGIGGFSKDGKEYVIITQPDKITPVPWSNVLANPKFGSVISESGQSYTWIENAHEFRLTPWNNDPVCDLAGECYYIRDEESGKFWSPTPLQTHSKTGYISRHGFGYSIFEHSEDGIQSEMTTYVDTDESIKFIAIKIHNASGRERKLSVTGYIEWVLGDLRSKTQMHIVTQLDQSTGAILVSNAYNTELDNRTAFFYTDEPAKSFTTDRAEFIGRNGSLRNPAGMNKAKLSGRSGAGLDPCTALQVMFEVSDGQEQEIIFKLGAGLNAQEAMNTIRQFKGTDAAKDSLDKVKTYWQQTLGVVQIETPDAALNILTNGWLNYQTLACRIWGRSGYYQSGGAFGFRDQLQDVLSILHTKPAIARRQILLHASRQFKEGDVQHWWHPPGGRGVRTTCSDDYLWLPYVVTQYVSHTGDMSILDESILFLEGRLLNRGEESYYDLPIQSNQSATLYVHCIKAIEHGLNFGDHGLPFIGSGDWNDGMDKVGEHGKGESVWLAFFLYDILVRFSEVAAKKTDTIFEDKCKLEAEKLKKNIEANAWDGQWYRRAYFDDGTPLGSSQNEECKIDSIAQSWGVLSKAAGKDRAEIAMKSASKHLIKKDAGLIQLFNPPFDKSSLNPGYIKGYVPGVRENGGQYTHAAIWLVMAFAALKEKQKTWELLQMINPVNRGNNAENIEKYKVEPYVMAADVYHEPLHIGRGGWTWYTGSASWMYQLIVESFLGIIKKGDRLYFEPCLPVEWKEFRMRYNYNNTSYNILIKQHADISNKVTLRLDDIESEGSYIHLVDDGKEHAVEVLMHDNEEIEV